MYRVETTPEFDEDIRNLDQDVALLLFAKWNGWRHILKCFGFPSVIYRKI